MSNLCIVASNVLIDVWQLCVFPGIPSLFQQLLLGLTPYLPLPPASSKPFRHLIFTK